MVPKMKMMLRSLATERRRRQRPTLRTPLRPLGRKRRRQLQARGMKSKGKSWAADLATDHVLRSLSVPFGCRWIAYT